MTLDQGSEWADWALLADHYDMKVWFCDPHSPWQRGAVENFNGHVRYWFPRGTDHARVSPEQADAATVFLNTQRRRSLDWDRAQDRWLAAGGVPLESPATRAASGLVRP